MTQTLKSDNIPACMKACFPDIIQFLRQGGHFGFFQWAQSSDIKEESKYSSKFLAGNPTSKRQTKKETEIYQHVYVIYAALQEVRNLPAKQEMRV